MTAYTDGVHLVADSRNELHEFAASAGIRRCWFHRDHYDLTNDKRRQLARAAGAVLVPTKSIVNLLISTGQWRRSSVVTSSSRAYL